MEEYFYIILLIIWLIVSLYKRKGKQQAQKSQTQPNETTAKPKELDLEEMLEEFFGGGKKSTQPKREPVDEEAVVISEMDGDTDYDTSLDEKHYADREPAYQSWESKAQQGYNEKKTESYEIDYSAFQQGSSAGESYNQEYTGLSEMSKVASVEELIRTHAAKDAMEQAKAEMASEGGAGEGIPEFDLRTAVIFSEILNKKYNT